VYLQDPSTQKSIFLRYHNWIQTMYLQDPSTRKFIVLRYHNLDSSRVPPESKYTEVHLSQVPQLGFKPCTSRIQVNGSPSFSCTTTWIQAVYLQDPSTRKSIFLRYHNLDSSRVPPASKYTEVHLSQIPQLGFKPCTSRIQVHESPSFLNVKVQRKHTDWRRRKCVNGCIKCEAS